MKILIIGNGFDLEHGLPTKYGDFLEFIKIINNIFIDNWPIKEKREYIDWMSGLSALDNNLRIYFLQNNFMDKLQDNTYIKELLHLSKDNIWIKYFFENIEYENKGWIDFESEISNVIKCFDYMKNYSEYNRKAIAWPREREQERVDKQEIVQKIIDYSGFNIEPFELIGSKIEIIINVLNEHLNNLIRCLEIYLEDCIDKIPVEYIAPDIKSFKPDKVLSFNYTKTHEKYYECNKITAGSINGRIIYEDSYEYIHGKANINREKEFNNMILGIDEYLDNNKKDNELDFIGFKKYYQRIYKQTGLEHNKWIKEIQENNYVNEIYLFGHSLDITDKDILYKLLVESNGEGKSNTKITIFYHDKKAYAQQIVNLIKIIGQDKLIERVSGAYPTIIFKQKSERTERS